MRLPGKFTPLQYLRAAVRASELSVTKISVSRENPDGMIEAYETKTYTDHYLKRFLWSLADWCNGLQNEVQSRRWSYSEPCEQLSN